MWARSGSPLFRVTQPNWRASAWCFVRFTAAHQVAHPEIPAINGIAYLMFREDGGDGQTRTATVMPPGRLDRSPCGTGSSAHLAALHARGRIAIGQTITTRSVIGSAFEVTLLGVRGGGACRRAARIRARLALRETLLESDRATFLPRLRVSDVWGPTPRPSTITADDC